MQPSKQYIKRLKYLSLLNTRILKLIHKGTDTSAQLIKHINEFKQHLKHEFL